MTRSLPKPGSPSMNGAPYLRARTREELSLCLTNFLPQKCRPRPVLPNSRTGSANLPMDETAISVRISPRGSGCIDACTPRRKDPQVERRMRPSSSLHATSYVSAGRSVPHGPANVIGRSSDDRLGDRLGGALSVGEHKPPQQEGCPYQEGWPHGSQYLTLVYGGTAYPLHHLRGTPSLPLVPRRSATWLPALSSSQARRFCAPASRRVCLYRGTGVRACGHCSNHRHQAYHSIAVFMGTSFANLSERCQSEDRETSLLRSLYCERAALTARSWASRRDRASPPVSKCG